MKSFLIIFVGSFFIPYISSHQHPHGKQIQLQFSTNIAGTTHDSFNYDKLKNILLHPEVQNRKVVILSIIGAYRKGKSFFLDYCLRYLYANYQSINTMSNGRFFKKQNWWGELNEPLTGFSWAGGSDPNTKGILIWDDVFLHQNGNEKIAIILMDTQGLFEPEADANLDAKIFGITSFLSSIEIFNLNGVIQENQLEYLKMVTDFSKFAVTRQSQNSQDTTSKPFQELLMLIRDWSDYDIGFGWDGGERYLRQKIFHSRKSKSQVAQSVRNSIKDSFDKVSAFCLPHPGKAVGKPNFHGQWSLLDEDFQDHLKSLIESLLSPDKLAVKKMLGKEVTAKELSHFSEMLFTAFESSELPQVDSIFNIIVKTQMNKLVEELFEEYKKKLDSLLNYDRDNFITDIFNDHKKTQAEVLNTFSITPKMCDYTTALEFENALAINTLKYFNQWKESKIETFKIKQEQKRNEERIKQQNEEIKRKNEEIERQQQEYNKRMDQLRKEALRTVMLFKKTDRERIRVESEDRA